MTLGTKFKDTVQVLGGRIKEGVGRTTGNRRLKRQGRSDRVTGNLKHAAAKAKDAFKR
jgi:uncharacterized protein YjbJ (UPF0337 family)